MAVKGGSQRRRGLSKGVKELAKLRSRSHVEGATKRSQKGTTAWALAKCARSVFNCLAYTAGTFHAVPMKFKDGVCSLITTKLDKFVHYCVLIFLFARIMNIFYVCSYLLFEEFRISTLLSLTVLVFLVLGVGMGCCNILVSKETVQLVNTWPQVVHSLEKVRGRPVDMFEDVALSIKIVGIGGILTLAPLVLTVSTLVFPDVPIFLQYQVRQIIPALPKIWSQLIFCPFELMAGVFTALMAAIGGCVLIISIGLLNLFGETMRNESLNTVAQYEKMTESFLLFKVYNAIVDVWYKVVTPAAFFVSSSAVVVCLYITFRHTDLPMYIYLFCPYAAFAIFLIEFGLCYDGLVVINATEETVGKLQSRYTKCFSRMSPEDKAAGLRWGKAMKPAVFTIGIFTEHNIAVPLGLWDEIVNQLLFLLSL